MNERNDNMIQKTDAGGARKDLERGGIRFSRDSERK
jgi:hypothetical protein